MSCYTQYIVRKSSPPGHRCRRSPIRKAAHSPEQYHYTVLIPQCECPEGDKPSNPPIVYVAQLPRTDASYGHRSDKKKSSRCTTPDPEETDNATGGCVTVKSECGQLTIKYNPGAFQETGVVQQPVQQTLPTMACTPICQPQMLCTPLCYYEMPQQPIMPMMTPLPPPTMMPPTPPSSPFRRSASRRRSRRARSSSRRRRSKSRKRESPHLLSLATYEEPGTAVYTQTEASRGSPSSTRRPPSISPKPTVSPPKLPNESPPPPRPIVQHKIVYQKTVPYVDDDYCVPCMPMCAPVWREEVYTDLPSDDELHLETRPTKEQQQQQQQQQQASAPGYEDVARFKGDAKYGRAAHQHVCCCPAVCHCHEFYDYDSANEYCADNYRRLRRMRPICTNRRHPSAERVLIPVELCKECEEGEVSGKPGPTKILISRT